MVAYPLSRRLGTRRCGRAFATVALAAAVCAPVAVEATAVSAAPPDGNAAHRSVSVMTRNLDEGTDFGYVFAAARGATPFSDAISLTYREVLTSDVCGRAARIADEIAAAQPDLVSLQEAAVWTGPIPAGCAGAGSPTTIDAASALMTRLAAERTNYVVVGQLDEFSSSAIAPLLPPGLSFLDRDVLLARVEDPGQLSVANVTATHFSTLLQLPLAPGLTIPSTRGWVSADATVTGRTVRVIATHLESFYEPVQEAQALELATGPANTSLPTILAGDLNSGPGSAQVATYGFLTTAAGFTDTWRATHPGDPGFTDSFYTEDPLAPAVPSERIDLVLTRGNVVPTCDSQVGGETPHPSDHAGVVATIRIRS